MKNIIVRIDPVAPSKDLMPKAVIDQFNWRKTGNYSGPSIIQVCDMQEPVWWNRPLHSDIMLKQEEDGLYSYNLPYIKMVQSFKTGYNILANKNSVPLLIMIKMNKKWPIKYMSVFNRLVPKAAYKALIALGVTDSKLTLIHNDVLYAGKKFIGSEENILNGWYGSASVITLNYTEEKDIFQRLTGEFALKRQICGIQEETGNIFTKEQFIEMLIKKLLEMLEPLED